ncbi:uncharacterized protein LOC110630755 [Manihot esculenta]|uniref:Uncharacterized protein n=2 Tax=Manihot esculenta TaxID=3983 RepID=A0ACB7GJH7_MANES|nr:uncharacterized protein LOC110630755 [Manihot esculenta]KAG8639818.1 hypothetical protein MANES_14G171900v8 [Manihot esculenta]
MTHFHKLHLCFSLSLSTFMGNATSCAPSIISNGVVKVLLSNGSLQIYTKPVKASELMLENPGKFLCEFNSLKIGQRINGLSADEELERCKLYFLLPMDLFYSVLTQEEMASFTFKATKANFKNNHFAKFIFPVLVDFCIFSSEIKRMDHIDSTCSDDHDHDHHDDGDDQPKLVKRYSKQRSWQPALETIVETPCRPI